ncbi:MAG: A1 family peptidase [Psychrosphaera sp.]|nr:A1 family peptidase [Psychrosphaera sp.]
MTKTVVIPLSNTEMENGDYTGTIYIGSNKTPVTVLFDTGSSTLSVKSSVYAVASDSDETSTNFAQEIIYNAGGWYGPVVKTDVALCLSEEKNELKAVNVAVMQEMELDGFGDAQGILGLAYQALNRAYELEITTSPWPWPEQSLDEVQDTLKTLGTQTTIQPYFTQLEESGVVANKFAFYAPRSLTSRQLANPQEDANNQGALIIGGGEEYDQYYQGSFQNIRVLDDTAYETKILTIQVGDKPPYTVPEEVPPQHNGANSFVDSGTTGLFVNNAIFQYFLGCLTDKQQDLIAGGSQQTTTNVEAAGQWPRLHLMMEGEDDTIVTLTVTPQNYWQQYAPTPNQSPLTIQAWPGVHTILGLPLFNNYFIIFDRTIDGLGVVKCAPIKSA